MHQKMIIALMTCVPALVWAQPSEAPKAMDRLLEHHMRQPVLVADLKAQILSVANRLDLDGQPGLTVADYGLSGLIGRAAGRSNELANFLRHDLNGDGAVSAAEIQPIANYSAAQSPPDKAAEVRETAIAGIMIRDLDGDGLVTVAEYNSPTTGPSFRLVSRSSLLWMELFARFDSDADNVTQMVEIEAVFDAAMLRVDTNSNDELDQSEIASFFERVREDGQFKPDPTLMPLIEAFVNESEFR